MASSIVRWLGAAGTVVMMCSCGGVAPAPSAPVTDVVNSPSPPPPERRGPVEVVELSFRAQGGADHRHMRAWRGGCFELSGLAAGSGQRVETKRKGCIEAGKAEELFGRLDKVYKTAKLAADPGYWPYDNEGLTLVGFPDAKGTLWIADDEATAAAFSTTARQLIDAAEAVVHQQDMHPEQRPGATP